MDPYKDSSLAVTLVEKSDSPQGVQLVSTKKSTKCDPMDLVELAMQIQKADQFTRSIACNKLMAIAEQVRCLQEQAKKVLEEAQRSSDLHHAACNFRKIPGNMYYLYMRPTGQKYLSMLSPEEWGGSCPHEFLGSYKLEYDMSWTPASKVQEKEAETQLIDRILNTKKPLSLECNF